MKQLLERKAGRGPKGEDGIRLSSAQRQALERVIRPTTTNRSVFFTTYNKYKLPRNNNAICYANYNM